MAYIPQQLPIDRSALITDHLSLVDIIAGRMVTPRFLPL